MPYLFAIFAIVWIIFNIPESGAPLWKMFVGIAGIIMILLAFFGVLSYHVMAQ